MANKIYPFEIKDVDESLLEELRTYYKGSLAVLKHVFIGPKNYLYPNYGDINNQLASIYEMEIRPSGIFIVTFPRSGTTMIQELVWLIANDLDYETAKNKHLIERYCVLGSYFINNNQEKQKLEEYKHRNLKYLNILTRMLTPPTEVMASMRGQRFIKCHIPLSLLPHKTLDIAKVIYVARDPRDLAVSLYHLYRLIKAIQFEGDFGTFWKFFKKGLVMRGPYQEHVKEAWQQRDHPNMLFLFYENLIANLHGEIIKICHFLDKTYTNEEIEGICEHLNINNFKSNTSVNLDFLNEFNALVMHEQDFIRNGKIGNWKEYFDDKMSEDAEKWIEDVFGDIDLEFPKHNLKCS